MAGDEFDRVCEGRDALRARVADLERQLSEPGYVDALREACQGVAQLLPDPGEEHEFDQLESLPAWVAWTLERLRAAPCTAHPAPSDARPTLAEAARAMPSGVLLSPTPLRTNRHDNEAAKALGEVYRHSLGVTEHTSLGVVEVGEAKRALASAYAECDALKAQLATVLAERDGAVSIASQLERERDAWGNEAKIADDNLTALQRTK